MILRELYADFSSSEIADVLGCSTDRVYNKAFALGLKKSAEYLKSDYSGRMSKARLKGIEYQFPKGNIPCNKGLKWSDFMTPEGRENSLKTTFKKGNTPHNTKSDGVISIRRDKYNHTYKYIRLAQGIWKPLHVYNWEQAYGPVQEGFIVVFKTADKMNCDVSNLELISRSEHMSRNSIKRYPVELRQAMKAIKKLTKAINGKE
jgi:hypothetical protein